jgi:hypothetical protein
VQGRLALAVLARARGVPPVTHLATTLPTPHPSLPTTAPRRARDASGSYRCRTAPHLVVGVVCRKLAKPHCLHVKPVVLRAAKCRWLGMCGFQGFVIEGWAINLRDPALWKPWRGTDR